MPGSHESLTYCRGPFLFSEVRCFFVISICLRERLKIFFSLIHFPDDTSLHFEELEDIKEPKKSSNQNKNYRLTIIAVKMDLFFSQEKKKLNTVNYNGEKQYTKHSKKNFGNNSKSNPPKKLVFNISLENKSTHKRTTIFNQTTIEKIANIN